MNIKVKIIISSFLFFIFSYNIEAMFFYTSGYLVKGLIPAVKMIETKQELTKRELEIFNMGVSMGYVNSFVDLSDAIYNNKNQLELVCIPNYSKKIDIYNHIINYYIPRYKEVMKDHSIYVMNESMKTFKNQCYE